MSTQPTASDRPGPSAAEFDGPGPSAAEFDGPGPSAAEFDGPGPSAAAPVRDRADVLVDLLGHDGPEADAETLKLSIRLRRLANHIERELRRELGAQGIEVWEFEVLL